MIAIIISAVNVFFQALIIIVIIDAILSFFLSPYQAIRRIFDQIVQPLLTPIRRIVPPFQNIDFSPLILIVLIQLLNALLVRILEIVR